MCSIPQKTFPKILLGQVWRVIPIHDWLELVLVNCPTFDPGSGKYPKKLKIHFIGTIPIFRIAGWAIYQY